MFPLKPGKAGLVELGLQTIHEDTASFIRRGYPLSTFTDAMSRLRARNLETIVMSFWDFQAKTVKRCWGLYAIWLHRISRVSSCSFSMY